MNVHQFPEDRLRESLDRLAQSGGPADNGGMDIAVLRAEFAELRGDLKASMAERRADEHKLRADFADLRGDLRASAAEMRADMHKTDSEHKKWILTTVLSVIGTGVAVSGFLFATLRDKPQAQPQQQSPVIINVPPAPAAPAAPAR